MIFKQLTITQNAVMFACKANKCWKNKLLWWKLSAYIMVNSQTSLQTLYRCMMHPQTGN